MELKYYLQAGQTNISNLLLKNYRKIGMSSFDLLVYLQLQMYQSQKLEMPDIKEISQNLGVNIEDIYTSIDNLQYHNLIEIEEDVIDNRKNNYYNLLPAYDKLNNLVETPVNNQDTLKALTMEIEELLGKPLSSNEMIMINDWENNYSKDLIILAMRESISKATTYPFKYANRILIDWQSKNILTIEEATKEINKFRERKTENNRSKIKVPLHNFGE